MSTSLLVDMHVPVDRDNLKTVSLLCGIMPNKFGSNKSQQINQSTISLSTISSCVNDV